jgi:hypothetical protein
LKVGEARAVKESIRNSVHQKRRRNSRPIFGSTAKLVGKLAMVGSKTSKIRKAILMTNARKTKAMTKGSSHLDLNGSDANKTPTDKESTPLTTTVGTNPPFANAEEANNPFANSKNINNPFACDKEIRRGADRAS